MRASYRGLHLQIAAGLGLYVLVVMVAQQNINIKDAINRIKDCYSADKARFNTCLFQFWKAVSPLLAAGIPELKIPSLDPLHVRKMEFSEHGDVVHGEAFFSDVVVRGLSGYVPKSVEADVARQTIAVELTVPQVDVKGRYKVDGSALFLPVKGEGPFTMKLEGVDGRAVAHVARDGTGIRLAQMDVDFAIRNITVHLGDLPGGPDFAASLNALVNENAQDILKDVKPRVVASLGETITKILANAIRELPSEAFVLPEGSVPPAGVVTPEDFHQPTPAPPG